MIESDMEKFIWNIFGWPHPQIIHTGLVSIKGLGAKISKSKSQKEVKGGEFIGWDDPRTWSVQSLKRRGFRAAALKKFVEEIGINKQDIEIPIDSLYAINRKMIDAETERYSFVFEPIKLKFKNKPKDIKIAEVKIHPEQDKKRKVLLGKDIFISKRDVDKYNGKEIRLMHLYNIKLVDKIEFTGEKNKNIQKVNWVSDFVNVRVLMENGVWISGLGESDVKKIKKNQVVQFERFGFVKFDKKNKAGEYEFWFTHS
jgi:glutamyl-tRNA synthetase